MNFTPSDSIKITFTGLQPVNLNLAFVGVSIGEVFTVQDDLFTPQAFLLTLQGTEGSNGAGLYQVSWDAIPEPTTSLLGAMGLALLVIRRRR